MRLRNVQGSYERLDEHAKVIKNPENNKGKWNILFNNTNPIHIEIGMGKGQFIIEKSKMNPNINYIGFEKYTSVLSRALDKIDKEENLENLVVVRADVEGILDIFGENEVNRIYLNFSDPWPKERHAKRRLTHINFLKKYNIILNRASNIIFKTDNEPLFDFSIEQIQEYGLDIKKITRDLHNSQYLLGNVMTEYERKFVSVGKPIYMVTTEIA
jgi:tRNA (guanine-N7-)-methyltransferase